MQFLIHQRHRHGWTTNVREAETPEEAMLLDILSYHPWLAEFPNEIALAEGRYSVTYLGGGPAAFGERRLPGDHWFSGQVRVGEEDDCRKCGGTGSNHDHPWAQCFGCGEVDRTARCGWSDGRSAGKRPIPAEGTKGR